MAPRSVVRSVVRARPSMARLTQLVLLAAAGALFAATLGTGRIEAAPYYPFFVACLLAVGLYASASGISREVVGDLRLVLVAVSVGVLCKAALIAGVMWLALGQPVAIVLGVAVAQIDPLSVAAMTAGSRLSPRARAILMAWASFDDPVTALLIVYSSALALAWSGTGGQVIGGPAGADLAAYGLNLGANLLLAGGCFAVGWLARRWGLTRRRFWRRWGTAVSVVALVALLAFAAATFLMLGVALVGLFFRPPAAVRLGAVTTGAFWLATFLLGMLLVRGVAVVHGLVLGAATFLAQVVVGLAITWRLPRRDRIQLALSQQNGITAIVLALTLEPSFPRISTVIAPAILVINTIHIVADEVAARVLGGAERTAP
ncbi:hypothetical protein [Nonomuraea sp. NPDC050783]|uniref:hypothetical protein n=1 Tax=Nonomuraea sp. NPDC050783 TaxID=3154634 RepID=UPI0034671D6B